MRRGARFLAPGETPEGLTLSLSPGVTVDVTEPIEALAWDPNTVGLATVDAEGRVLRGWGLAAVVPDLRVGSDLRQGPFEGILRRESASIRLGGVRAVATPEPEGGWRLLVVDAGTDQGVEDDNDRLARLAQGLKRLGKALSMNQNLSPLCMAAVHEIASTAELAAVMLWRLDQEGEAMELMASVGVNRQGSIALNRLTIDGVPECAAQLAVANRRPFYAANVLGHALTGETEGRFCYLHPGGVRVLPLEISGRLLGVLELVGREGDTRFEDDRELHETFSEHLALALNGANLYENLERLASHDPITGLANHRAMQDFLHWRVAECDRTGGSLGCIMIDVDRFRNFNETEGHDTGDAALRQVAEALRSAVRPYDLAARYGGEEFTVVVPGASPAGVRALAERLRDRVASRPFVTAEGKEVPLTISLGCAVYPAQGPGAAGLLKAADVALYEAKRGGRNRVEGPGDIADRSIQELRLALGGAGAAGLARLAQLAAEVDGLAMALRLTPEQRIQLESLVVAAEGEAPESLAPLLEAARRPHDPAAPAPLLARSLRALLGLTPADPELADLVSRLRGNGG